LQAEANLTHGQIDQVLKYFGVENPAPVIRQGYKWFRTPVPYRLDHDRIRRLTQKREFEWQEVQGYVDTEECLMAYLGQALDDSHAGRCGKCANCIGRPVVPVEIDPELTRRALLFLGKIKTGSSRILMQKPWRRSTTRPQLLSRRKLRAQSRRRLPVLMWMAKRTHEITKRPLLR